ncbi:MAG: hypothetical protein IKC16_06665 [Clostridia bacterium]|nr:hypothetical protein [Clostridia bacterium]
MKRKIFISILLVLLSLLCVAMLTACGDEKEQNEENTDEAVECQHDWRLQGEKIPTCTEAGERNLKCALCSETKTVRIEAQGCDYVEQWHWSEDYSSAYAVLTCPADPAHNKTISAVVKKEQTDPTCQSEGLIKYTATIEIIKTYEDTKEVVLPVGECDFEYEFYLEGESCIHGYDANAVCKNCGKEVNSSHEDHILFPLAKFKTCGGYAVFSACPCGKEVDFFEPEGCLGEVEKEGWSEEDEDGIIHNFEHKFCIRCDFEIIYDRYVTEDECIAYQNCVYNVMDGEEVLFSILSEKYDAQYNHALVYTYEGGEIDSCENGYTCHVECKACGYEADVERNDHAVTFPTEKISFSDFGACGGYLQKKECPCGEKEDAIFVITCDAEYNYDLFETENEVHTTKTYMCKDCGLELVYDEYILNGNSFTSYTLKINGEVKYEYEFSND